MVADGEVFALRLFAGLRVPVRPVWVARPNLDDDYMTYTWRTIGNAEATGSDKLRPESLGAGEAPLKGLSAPPLCPPRSGC